MRALLAAACAFLVAFAGCLQDTGTPSDTPGPSADDTYRVIAQGSRSAIHEQGTFTAETASEFATLWARHTNNETAKAPTVDFTTHRVVAMFAGESFTACHLVRIANVTTDEAADTTKITWTIQPPAEGTGCTKQIAQPFLFAAVKQRDTAITFASDLPVTPAEARLIEAPLARETERRYALFSDPASWQGAMARDQAAPEVNFATEQVLVAYMGERPNGCYGVSLGNVTTLADGIRVDVRYQGPGPEAYCTQALVHPTLAVAIPITDRVYVQEQYDNLTGEPSSTPKQAPGATFLANGEAQGIDEKRVAVIDNEADWAALWEEAEFPTDQARPTVDFTTNRVVAVILGADTACEASGGVGAIHSVPASGGGKEYRIDALLWNAPENIQCIRGSPHPAAFYTFPAGGTATIREIVVNGLPG